MELAIYVVTGLFGIVVGSFLNVLICRLPKKENIVIVRSHCVNCGYQLKWYDLFPLFSYLFLGGKCRKCKTHISYQYPIIEALNGALWICVMVICGISIESMLACFVTSIFIVIAVIDWRYFIIPEGLCYGIFALGVIETILDYSNWISHVIGFGAVSIFFLIIHLINKNWLGGGDVRLMAVCGLFLGWQNVLLGMVLGCIIGSVIHLIRMKIWKVGRQLSFGPYLVVGLWIAMLFGEKLIEMYLSLLY